MTNNSPTIQTGTCHATYSHSKLFTGHPIHKIAGISVPSAVGILFFLLLLCMFSFTSSTPFTTPLPDTLAGRRVENG